MSKKQERIATIALAAFLVGYFAYQVAYGAEMTIGANGTIPFSGNGTSAEFSGPPGTVVSNPSIHQEPNGYSVGGIFNEPNNTDKGFINFANSTWKMYNETSGSTSTITFGDSTYTRSLHDNDLQGNWNSHTDTVQTLQLCPSEEKWMAGCETFNFHLGTPSITFYDLHGDVIHLMR